MKYAVDKVEDDIVLLENIINGEKITVKKEDFSFPVKETDIVIKKDDAYLKDDKEKEDRIKMIKAKMEALRKKE
mgnify:CR=1 FL=1